MPGVSYACTDPAGGCAGHGSEHPAFRNIARVASCARRDVRILNVGALPPGILLGPSGMGQANPDVKGVPNPNNPTAILFPVFEKMGPSNTRNYLNVLAQLGVVVFMFVVGLEVRLPRARNAGREAVYREILLLVLPAAPYIWAGAEPTVGARGILACSLQLICPIPTCGFT